MSRNKAVRRHAHLEQRHPELYLSKDPHATKVDRDNNHDENRDPGSDGELSGVDPVLNDCERDKGKPTPSRSMTRQLTNGCGRKVVRSYNQVLAQVVVLHGWRRRSGRRAVRRGKARRCRRERGSAARPSPARWKWCSHPKRYQAPDRRSGTNIQRILRDGVSLRRERRCRGVAHLSCGAGTLPSRRVTPSLSTRIMHSVSLG